MRHARARRGPLASLARKRKLQRRKRSRPTIGRMPPWSSSLGRWTLYGRSWHKWRRTR
nr:MAG TPA: hypothetical protein [Caudoviricetes sp.]